MICATARVGTRAFYEEFDSREALLLEVATQIVESAGQAARAALADAPLTLQGTIAAGLSTFLGFMTSDPRRAKVIYGAVPCAEPLTPDRHRAARGFVEMLAAQAAALDIAPRALGNNILALALTGAIGELLGFWVVAPSPPPIDDIVEELTHLFHGALS